MRPSTSWRTDQEGTYVSVDTEAFHLTISLVYQNDSEADIRLTADDAEWFAKVLMLHAEQLRSNE